MSSDKTCGYRHRSLGPDIDEVCGQPADVIDRGDGTYLCHQHAAAIRDEQPERRFKQIDRTYDQLIAEHLFESQVCEKDAHEDCPTGEPHLPVQEMPYFAERAEEANRVIERLLEDEVDLRADGVASWLPDDWQYVFSDPESEPLAICVAALTAKGVKL